MGRKTDRFNKIQSRKTIQLRVEKTFKRLMIQFLVFYGKAEDPKSKEVQDKINELNDVWIAYCDKLGKAIMPEGKKEFMNHVDKAIEQMSKPLIPQADDSQ